MCFCLKFRINLEIAIEVSQFSQARFGAIAAVETHMGPLLTLQTLAHFENLAVATPNYVVERRDRVLRLT